LSAMATSSQTLAMPPQSQKTSRLSIDFLALITDRVVRPERGGDLQVSRSRISRADGVTLSGRLTCLAASERGIAWPTGVASFLKGEL
jgi:hypothetical protein